MAILLNLVKFLLNTVCLKGTLISFSRWIPDDIDVHGHNECRNDGVSIAYDDFAGDSDLDNYSEMGPT